MARPIHIHVGPVDIDPGKAAKDVAGAGKSVAGIGKDQVEQIVKDILPDEIKNLPRAHHARGGQQGRRPRPVGGHQTA